MKRIYGAFCLSMVLTMGAMAQDIAPTLQWNVIVTNYVPVRFDLRRGETINLQPTFLQSTGIPFNISGATQILFRYRPPVPGGPYYQIDGTVVSATGGVVNVRWAVTNETLNDLNEYEIVAVGSSSVMVRAFGTMRLNASVSGGSGVTINPDAWFWTFGGDITGRWTNLRLVPGAVSLDKTAPGVSNVLVSAPVQIVAVSGRVDVVEANVGGTSGTVATLQGQYLVTSGKVDSAVAGVVAVSGRVDTVAGQYLVTSGRVDGAVAGVVAVSGRVDTVAANVAGTSVTVATLQGQYLVTSGRVDGAVAGVVAVSGRVDTVAGQYLVTSGKVDNAVAGVVAVSGRVDTVAGQYLVTSGMVDGAVAGVVAVSGRVDGVVSGIDAVKAAIKEPTGFASPEDVTVSYDQTNRTVTLTQSGGINVWWRGTNHVWASPWTSAAHAQGNAKYYLSCNTGTNAEWSSLPWSFDKLQIAYVYSEGGTNIGFRECHGLMPWQTHEVDHYNVGTWRISGLFPDSSTFAIQTANPVDSSNTPSFASGVISDEDCPVTIDAWPQDIYTTLRFSGTGVVEFVTNSASLMRLGTTYPMVNAYNGTSFSETETVSSRYLNYYQLLIPVSASTKDQIYRTLILQPQFAYTSLALAQAEDFRSLYLGNLTGIAPEMVAFSRITMRTQSSYNNATGRARIEGISYLVGSKATQVSISALPVFNEVDPYGLPAAIAVSGRVDVVETGMVSKAIGLDNLYKSDGGYRLTLGDYADGISGAHISNPSGNAWVALDSWDYSGISWLDTNGNSKANLFERGSVGGGDEGVLRFTDGSWHDWVTISTQFVSLVPMFWGTNQLAVNHQIFLESNRIDNIVYWKDNNVATFMRETLKDVDAVWGNILQLALDAAARSDYISMPGVNRITTTFAKGDTNGLNPLTSFGYVTNAGYMETKITNYTEGGTMTDTFHMNFNEANGATNFPDLAGVSWTEVGTPTRSTTTKKYGAGSIYLDGDGDYLTAPDEAAYEMGANNWTMEMWVNTDNPESNMEFLTKVADTSVGPMRWLCSRGDGNPTAVTLMLNGNVIVTGSNVFNPAPNTWVHLAMVRDGNTIRSFTNGILDGSASYSGTVDDTGDLWYLGAMAYRGSTSYDYEGYIDEFRYVVGSANYTNDFTPPESEVGTGGTTVYVKNKMTLVSKPTALDDSYSSVRSMIVWTNTDANVTNNVDVRHYWSLDNGSNWTQMLTARSGDVAGIPSYYSTNVTVPAGSTALWKTECTNKSVKVYMHSGGIR